MKSFKNTNNIFSLAFLVLLTTVLNGKSIDLKLVIVPSSSTNVLMVDVQVRNSDRNPINLGGQNIRLYYNSDALQLNQDNSVSQLPTDRYSKINFSNLYENMNADEVNQLSFDNKMGFVSFSIDLADNKNGGIVLKNNDHWVSIARLEFNQKDSEKIQMVFGRSGRTNEYATAYVEMAEWIAPYQIEALELNEVIDLDESKSVESLNSEVEIKIGPNPASDFVQINFGQVINEDITVLVMDLSGRAIKSLRIAKGSKDARISLSEVNSSSYIIRGTTNSNDQFFSQRVSVIH